MSILPLVTEKVPPMYEALAVDRLTPFETAQAYRLEQAGLIRKVRDVAALIGVSITGIPYSTSKDAYLEAVITAVHKVVPVGEEKVRKALAAHDTEPKQTDDPRAWAWSMALALA